MWEIIQPLLHYYIQPLRHRRRHKGTASRLRCDVCEKKFGDKDGLAAHVRVHTRERPFPFGLCPKSFTQLSSQRSHLRTHTRERPFQYRLCQKSFSTTTTCKVHMKIHRTKEAECGICRQVYWDKSGLAKHTRLHTGEFTCDFCQRQFSKRSQLTVHLLIHTKEKSWPCESNKASFKTKTEFVQHKKMKVCVAAGGQRTQLLNQVLRICLTRIDEPVS